MANDIYAECLVKKTTPKLGWLIKILLAAGILLSAFSIFYIGLFGFIAFLLVCLTGFYWMGKMNTEYEYLLADKQFSVDCIYNKSRRKKMAEYHMEEIMAIAPEHSEKIQNYERQVKKVTDISSGRHDANRYAFICQKSGVYEKVIFEPDDNLIHCFKLSAPGKLSEH